MAASVASRAYSKPTSLDGDLLIVCQRCSAGCFLDRSPIRDQAENFPRRLVRLRNLCLPARSYLLPLTRTPSLGLSAPINHIESLWNIKLRYCHDGLRSVGEVCPSRWNIANNIRTYRCGRRAVSPVLSY
jgi:hypothetical protein